MDEKASGAKTRGIAKIQDGIVISNKMQKTVVVMATRKVRHAQYGKFVTRSKKYYAHDERSECQMGDLVRIVETRPLSKTKRWRVREILKHVEVA